MKARSFQKCLSMFLIVLMLISYGGILTPQALAEAPTGVDNSMLQEADANVAAVPDGHLRVHYQRTASDYDNLGLWVWNDVASPSTNWPSGAVPFPAGQTDSYGAYTDIPLAAGAKKIGFLVVDRISGNKDSGDKTFTFLDQYNEVWIKQGDDRVYISPDGALPIGLISAEVLSESKLLLGFTMTGDLDPAALPSEVAVVDSTNQPVAVNGATITGPTTVELSAVIDLSKLPLSVTYSGKTISASTGWRMLDEMYAYDGNDLGAAYSLGQVTLKLWAPTASAVTVNFYDKTDATKLVGSAALAKGDKGVWSATVAPADLGDPAVTDLKGYFYQYEVTNNGMTKKVLDPYAKSMAAFRVGTDGLAGPDGDTVGKAAIVDLGETNPDGYDYASINGYEKREDAIVWEIHVRDFTSDPSIESDLNTATWGTYDAFKQKLDYIQSLGVTHIQLLPVMAWYYGDEMDMKTRELAYSSQGNNYNWGYDPHSYFSPDGAYSENPADPTLRIKELKAMIDAIHDAGMGVILDVVYTHMAKADFLNDIVPNYYAFQDANGNNIGGFGNNLATSHKMAEKLMIDSVKYWFEEYKIDGMRWDMMGDATSDAVQHAYDAAAAINPKALFIGEGWRTFGGQLSDPALAGKGADQDWMDNTNSVGVFSDEIRNELKSGYGSEGEPRFITGGARSIQTIFNNIKAQPGNVTEDDPGDIVQYIEAHDNLPLYDVIAQSIKKDPAIAENDLEIHKRVRLGNLLVLTSQGTAFLHAGQEYGRTKQWLAEGTPEHKYHTLTDVNGVPFTYPYFIHDSYDSSDAINKFDWAKATNADLFPVNDTTKDYTAGLIALRKSTNAFRLGDQALVDANVTLIGAPEIQTTDTLIAYKNKATDGTGNYYVFVNADNAPRTLTLAEDLTGSAVVVDNDEAGAAPVSAPSGFTLTADSITLEPLTAVILKTTSSTDPDPVPTKRYIQFNYSRADQDYTDWNIWIWNTGVKNDQIDFTKFENGMASVEIEIAPNVTSVGFILRKGTNWDTAKQDIPDDRYITVSPDEAYTKVYVTSMVRELDILPSITGPELKDGAIRFLYRDDSLFKQGLMHTISKVQVKVAGQIYDMVYDPGKEWFSYTLTGLEGGSYEYTFLVTKDGQTTEITDPKNTVGGKSVVVYHKPTVQIDGSVNPGTISSNENAVLTISAASSEPVTFTGGYLDLTALGGPSMVNLDTALMAQTIAVKDTVTAGVKSIPITLIDQYGNKHTGSASVNVKARIYAGELDFDWDEARIYFVLTDRFLDGDTTNNELVDKTHLEAYHGGDFQGLIDKLDYLDELGINTLWITPIVDNIEFNKGADFGSKQYGYHGYWAKNFSALEEHLGDLETFQTLIEKAHDKGIKIMVDVVLNHTGYGLKPDDNRPGITQEDKDRFAGMLRTDGVSADTDPIKGELAGLPDFKTEDPAVRNQVIAWQTEWLNRAKTERGDTIDYFRVDTVKHVDSTTLKAFKNALTTINPSFKMIGEQFGATVDSNGGQLHSGQMDALLDFGFKDKARDFVNGSIDAVDAYLADRETKLDNTTTMGQFLSSHDENGFLSHYVGGDKGKLKIAASLQITAKGQPVIYYGEELGRSGANAGDMSAGQFSENRADMPWDQLQAEKALHDHYKTMLNIRAKFSKVYAKGTRTKLAGSDAEGFLAFNKHYTGQDVVTILNVTTDVKTVTIPVPFSPGTRVKDEYSGATYRVSADQTVTIQVPGRDQGGTAVLSGTTVTEPGGDVFVIDPASLLQGSKGEVTIQIPQNVTKALLPAGTADILKNKDLKLVFGKLSVTLPRQTLKEYPERILVEALKVNAYDIGPSSSFEIYSIKLSIYKDDGTTVPIQSFKKPISLSFQVDALRPKDQVSVYYIDANGKFEPIRGKLANGVITVNVSHLNDNIALLIFKG